MNITYENGIATLPDGKTINLLKVQQVCNHAFQELGDQDYANAADDLSLITGLVQGPHGEWEPRLNTAKVEISKLLGPALDWAVAQDCRIDLEKDANGKVLVRGGFIFHRGKEWAKFSPSTDWAEAGPSIERHQIDITSDNTRSEQERWQADDGISSVEFGPTPLVAAARVLVSIGLGNGSSDCKIDVPNELL